MSTEEIKIGNETHTIETKPITLIFPSANMAAGPPIEYPKRLPLDFEVTTFHAMKVQNLHSEFEQVWKNFISNTSNPFTMEKVTADEIRKMGKGAIHVMGLIDMSLKLQDINVPFAWVYPETNLHPGWQVALADLAIFFTKRAPGTGKIFVKNPSE